MCVCVGGSTSFAAGASETCLSWAWWRAQAGQAQELQRRRASGPLVRFFKLAHSFFLISLSLRLHE